MLPQWTRLQQGESHVRCHLGPRWRGDPPSGAPAADTCASVCLQSPSPCSSLRSLPGNSSGISLHLSSPWTTVRSCCVSIPTQSQGVDLCGPCTRTGEMSVQPPGSLARPCSHTVGVGTTGDGLVSCHHRLLQLSTAAPENSRGGGDWGFCLNIPSISVSLRGPPRQVGKNNILITSIEKNLSNPVWIISSIYEHSS